MKLQASYPRLVKDIETLLPIPLEKKGEPSPRRPRGQTIGTSERINSRALSKRMIIPVRCVTCNKVISDKWRWYARELAAAGVDPASDDSFDPDSAGAEMKRELFDAIGLVRYCCRRHFMGHVDLVEKI